MATLLIDLGNTRIKWAWMRGAGLGDYDAHEHHGQPLASLQPLWQQAPQRVLINSVLGPDLQAQIQASAEPFGLTLHWATSSDSFEGLRNGYRQPAQLGSDRWLGMIAAQQNNPGRCLCVVSCGTAVTIDAISPQGKHLGGMILPGLRLMQQSLKQGTRQVDAQEQNEPPQMLADHTSAAVHAGCHYGVVGAISQMLAKVSVEYNEIVKCIVTGGDAEKIRPLLEARETEHRPHLVLEGLALWGKDK